MKNKEIVKRIKDSLDYEFDLSFNERRELLLYIEQLEKRNKELYEGFMATQEELTDYATKNEQLENNRDKAIEYVEHHKFNKFGDIDCNEAEDIIDILKGDSDD